MIISTRLRFLKNERETWIRTLDYLQQENVFLKNSLADIIKHEIAPGMLENAEYFQNQFITKDDVIALLRYDIAEQNKLTEKSKEINKTTISKQEKLRADMEKMEKEFSRLKFQFNNYLAQAFMIN